MAARTPDRLSNPPQLPAGAQKPLFKPGAARYNPRRRERDFTVFHKLTTSTCILALAFSLAACKKDAPAGTSNPPDASADAGKTKKKRGGKKGGDEGGSSDDGGDGGGEDLTQTVCEPEVGETPTVYFEETIMLRLPKGLNEENLVERQPGFARTTAPALSVSCVEGLPEVEIRSAFLGSYSDDPEKDMKTWATEIIEGSMQIPAGAYTFEDVAEKGRKIEMSVVIPASDMGPEGKAWMALKAGGGFMFFAYYEVHPNTWNAIKKTFKASTDKMLILAK